MRNIGLRIEYDGTNYCGWQIQKGHTSIQEIITNALSKITGHKITLYSAGRTDSGVHAEGQVANFLTTSLLSVGKFVKALNHHLPKDIVVRNAREMPKSFNARYRATGKLYRYTILNSPIPTALNRNYCYYYPYKINLNLIKKAAKCLVGTHNFRAFASKAALKKSCVRTLSFIRISRKGRYVYINIQGNGFLYNMVRTIVGTLLWVNQGKMSPRDIAEILNSQERRKAGPTIAAKGLCMVKVLY